MVFCKRGNVLNGFMQPVNGGMINADGKVDNTFYVEGTNCIDKQVRSAEELNDALNNGSEALELSLLNSTSGVLTTEDGTSNIITPTSTTSFFLLGGTGQLIDRSQGLSGIITRKIVTWESQNIDITPLLPGPNGNFNIVVDEFGVVSIVDSNQASLITLEQYLTLIQLGLITVIGGEIIFIDAAVLPAYAQGIDQYSLGGALGVINDRTFAFSIEPTKLGGLRFQINPGQIYAIGTGTEINPETPNTVLQDTAIDPQSLIIYGLADDTLIFSPTNEIDPTQWESSPGVLSPVGNNKFTLQRIFLFVIDQIIGVFYGDEIFNSLQEAKDASLIPPRVSPVTALGIHIADLAIEQSAVDFSQPEVLFSLFDPLNVRN